jgi:hypothetical protein
MLLSNATSPMNPVYPLIVSNLLIYLVDYRERDDVCSKGESPADEAKYDLDDHSV